MKKILLFIASVEDQITQAGPRSPNEKLRPQTWTTTVGPKGCP
jgi:hypothetical protein